MAGAVLFAALLSGCASEQPVRVSAYRNNNFGDNLAGGSAKTYALQASPGDAAKAEPSHHSLDEALAAKGFQPALADHANYLVTLGYATRPQAVEIRATCTSAPGSVCDDVAESKDFFHRKRYVHALTVQFAERTNGALAYQISVTHADRNPAGDAALPGLMKCAFKGFPLKNAERQELVRCD